VKRLSGPIDVDCCVPRRPQAENTGDSRVLGDSISAGYGLARVETGLGWRCCRRGSRKQEYGYQVVQRQRQRRKPLPADSPACRGALMLHQPKIVILELGRKTMGYAPCPSQQMRANLGAA